MKSYKVVCCIAAMATLLVSGCATTFPDRSNPEAQSIADEIHDHLDRHTGVIVSKDDASGRLLRAYFLVAAFSVYGNASIERYSHSPSGDAGALLGRIMAAEAALQVALNNYDRNYFPVDRARLVFAIADLAARAVRPTATMATGLLGTMPTPVAGARLAVDLFKNAVENKVFGDAYFEGFQRSICQLNTGTACTPPLPVTLTKDAAADLGKPAWTDLNQILKATCDELKVKARLQTSPMQCGTIVAKPAPKPAAKPAPAG